MAVLIYFAGQERNKLSEIALSDTRRSNESASEISNTVTHITPM